MRQHARQLPLPLPLGLGSQPGGALCPGPGPPRHRVGSPGRRGGPGAARAQSLGGDRTRPAAGRVTTRRRAEMSLAQLHEQSDRAQLVCKQDFQYLQYRMKKKYLKMLRNDDAVFLRNHFNCGDIRYGDYLQSSICSVQSHVKFLYL